MKRGNILNFGEDEKSFRELLIENLFSNLCLYRVKGGLYKKK
jgi:hypothetical protein